MRTTAVLLAALVAVSAVSGEAYDRASHSARYAHLICGRQVEQSTSQCVLTSC